LPIHFYTVKSDVKKFITESYMKKLMFPCRCPLRAKRLFKFLGMKLPEEKSICVMGCNEKTVEQSAKPTDMIRKVINQKRREILQNMDPITVLKNCPGGVLAFLRKVGCPEDPLLQ
jgi:hypothetical protein